MSVKFVDLIAQVRRDEETERITLETEKKTAKARKQSGKPKVIGFFNTAFDVGYWLLEAGYAQDGNSDSYRHPNSKSGNFSCGVQINEQGIERAHALSPNDLLFLPKKGAHDAFSCFTALFHAGNPDAALRAAGDLLNSEGGILAVGQVTWNERRQEKADSDALAELPDYATKEVFNGDVLEFFRDITLTEAQVDGMEDAVFLIQNIIVSGHITAYPSPANGGKTTLFKYFCEELTSKGMTVLYVNADAGPGELRSHFVHAKKHGYAVISPDVTPGKSASNVTEKLKVLVDSGAQLDKFVFILDTLKKFVDVISKPQAKEFYKLLRAVTVRGGTICLLCHTNKYPGEDKKQIFEGTADLRNDIDDMIYLDSYLNERTKMLEITTRPDKVRAVFNPVSFQIDKDNGLKVTPVLGTVVNILPKTDRDILDLLKEAIGGGFTRQGEIIEYVKERCNAGDKKIRTKLKYYRDCCNPEIKATSTGKGKELFYEVINPLDYLNFEDEAC